MMVGNESHPQDAVKVRGDRLSAGLDQALEPIYLVAGDEPLLVNEAADAIRAAARRQGFEEREVHVAQRGFDWAALQASCDNLSLFAARRLVELRLPTGKPGDQGSKALVRYAGDPPADVLLLVTAPKLDRGTASSRWVKALEGAGCQVDIRAPDERQLPRWIETRMRSLGLEPSAEAVRFLAERVEGNLLAAVQEMEKLLLLRGARDGKLAVDLEAVREAVADSARYDVFQLVDAAVAGNAGRALHVLEGLWAEGVAAPLILWALTRELRQLNRLAWRVEHGESLDAAFTAEHVWYQRKQVLSRALRQRDAGAWRALLMQAAAVERVVKGVRPGSALAELRGLVAGLAGVAEVAALAASRQIVA